MHEIAQIYIPFHLSSTINLVFFFMENIIKGTHALKMITRNSLNIKKIQREEKFARLTTLKDSLGKK